MNELFEANPRQTVERKIQLQLLPAYFNVTGPLTTETTQKTNWTFPAFHANGRTDGTPVVACSTPRVCQCRLAHQGQVRGHGRGSSSAAAVPATLSRTTVVQPSGYYCGCPTVHFGFVVVRIEPGGMPCVPTVVQLWIDVAKPRQAALMICAMFPWLDWFCESHDCQRLDNTTRVSLDCPFQTHRQWSW